MERIDGNGTWESEDGVMWILIAPSELFYSQQSQAPDQPPPSSPEVVAAQAISDEISARINEANTISEIKLAITEGLAAAILSLGG